MVLAQDMRQHLQVAPSLANSGNPSTHLPSRISFPPQDRTQTLKEYTQQLLSHYARNPSPKLRNRLVELNLGLVRQEAHRWKHKCKEQFDDLVQIGSLGLISAIERFDSSRGLALSSFAVPYIRGEIQHYLRDKGHSVRIPRRWYALSHRIKRVTLKLQEELGRQPSQEDLRLALELTVEEWQEFKLAQKRTNMVSLDAPLYAEGEGSCLSDTLPDKAYHSFRLAEEDSLRLRQLMEHLEERARQVIDYVFFQDLTQKETAARMNISTVTVSRSMKKALKQLTELEQADNS